MNAFDNIINDIRTSNLNFQLQISPYSAQISLKKSLIQEKSGYLHSTSTLKTPTPASKVQNSDFVIAELAAKNLQLEKDLTFAVEDGNNCRVKLKSLEHEIIIKKESEDKSWMESLEHELKNLKNENEKLKDKIKEQKDEIVNLEKIVKTKADISSRLNRELCEVKNKNEEECSLAKGSLPKKKSQKLGKKPIRGGGSNPKSK